ncbi:MAG TPA: hypothetical protein VF815_27380, partial [Myxococcaceae bacterium]
LEQLRRALAASLNHPEASVRARALAKVERWQAVLEGLAKGSLAVGSRQPVAGIPTWVTLGVAHGGFATGQLLAGGPLEPHERERLATLPDMPGAATERFRLNAWYLSDGQRELAEALRSGCYRVHLPEEGALLMVTWLLGRGEVDPALELIEKLQPLTDRLRFYPVPDPRPFSPSAVVRLQPVSKTVEQLDEVQPRPQIVKMNETLRVWNRLYDRTVALFLETVQGELPSLETQNGELVRRPDGQPRAQGGWPCKLWPEGWNERARQVLQDYRTERQQHTTSGKPDHPKGNFSRLRGFLERCVADPRSLTGRDVGAIRKILASYVTRHGAPGSEQLRRVREAQAQMAERPTGKELAMLMAGRLRGLPGDEGLSTLDIATAPVSQDESAKTRVTAGYPIPPQLVTKVERSLEAPIDQLVERQVITSSEVLATVLPQITSQVGAAGIEDPDLRRLYAAVYAAFRRRRSLLLLNLESQVRLDELPWVAAMRPFRKNKLGAQGLARQTLEQISALAITSFPQTILPNKLLQEMSALSKEADLKLPLVEELAADIFMGEFSMKFLEAARTAAKLLQGTLYARYYGIPVVHLLKLDDRAERWGKDISPGFAALCTERAEPKKAGRWSVARNGTILEQSQILTTHNLAVLFDALGLKETLRPALPYLARQCFRWVVRQQTMKVDLWKAQLQMVKNTAYAWRQMLFFLALIDQPAQEAFLAWAREHLQEQDEPFRSRFEPIMAGLEWICSGREFDPSGRGGPQGQARRFLGWSDGKHWMFE